MTDDLTPAPAPVAPPLNRALLEADLSRIARGTAPLVEAQLQTVFDIPLIGPLISARLPDSVERMTSSALGRLSELTDEELLALLGALGRELGAIAGYLEPLSSDEWTALGPLFVRLVAALEGEPPAE